MAGKMTILDRLMQEGKISQFSPGRKLGISGELRDPMSYPLEMRKAIKEKYADNKSPRTLHGNYQWVKMTPEREVYQQGLESLRRKKMNPVREAERGVRKDFEDLQSNFEDAYSDAYENWQDELNSNVADQAPLLEYGFEPADLDFDTPRADLRDFWPAYQESPEWFESEAGAYNDRLEELGDQLEYMRSPEYIQQLQTQTPRYRNYQRAMQQRAANKRMGHQLSRMWGDAYNRLRARGLSDAEARMFIRERFGR